MEANEFENLKNNIMKNGNNLIHSFNDTVAQGNFNGLTKREYFAGLAMQGLLACSIGGRHKNFDLLSKEAIVYADELLKQLETKK